MLLSHSANESAGRRAAIAIGFVFLSLTAGCFGFGTSPGQTGPVALQIANEGNTTHEFSVMVADGELGPDSVAVDRANRDVEYLPIGQGLVTISFNEGLGTVTSLGFPPNRTESVGTYRLAPDEQMQTNVTDFETGDTLIVVDRRDDHVATLVTANCDETGLTFVAVTAGREQPFTGYSCE
ncbi:hypothetical protein [Haloarcula amylolytica]|uniref:Uncharacterized protein n=1 Tax=Haloarcula amylolytica JCM 13557 TaxID=1227452 RepID=M0KU64_9EURY|nr:hypothetical protein [Haloarcula amylolytica]EMA23270.1 hypothetical protein C442_05881 [Haloarcula amylolytica JCM 13557]